MLDVWRGQYQRGKHWGGCEDSDDDSGDPVGEQEVIAHWQHPQRDSWSECSGDEAWSDEENCELWSKLDSDDDYHCPYEPLTLEEALTQIEDRRKARHAVGWSEDRISRTSRCYGKSSPAVAEWVADEMEYLPIFEVESGEIKVAAACLEYWIQLYDQRSPVLGARDFKAKSVAVHLRKEAVYIETKGMQVTTEEANRAEMTLESCSTLALRPSAVEVGMGQTPHQSAYHVWKLVPELSFVKVPRVHQSRQSWESMIKFDQGGPLGEIRTTARNQSQMKQQPWVSRDMKHPLSRPKPELLRVNGQDEPARVELQVASDTDISKRQELPVSWWLCAAWILMMARLLNLGGHTLLNKSSTPVATFSSTSLSLSERWRPGQLQLREESSSSRDDDPLNQNYWRTAHGQCDKKLTFFEFSDRSWIRWKVVAGIGRRSENASKVQNAVLEADARAMNDFNTEVKLLRPESELVDHVPVKLAQIWWRSMQSKVTNSTTQDKPKSLRGYDGQNWIWDSGGEMHEQMRFQMMSTAEGKCWRKLNTRWDSIKMSALKRALGTGQRSGDEEQAVAVSNSVLQCWVCHRKHGRWKDDIRVHKMLNQGCEDVKRKLVNKD